jgi:hypothetical protein
LHAELADQPDEMRAEQLRDEVQRVVGGLPTQERESFLRDLLTHFPVWSAGGEEAAPARPKAAETRDPLVMADRLVELSRGLSDAERQQVIARLKAGGLAVSGNAPASAPPAASVASSSAPASVRGDIAMELRKQLGLKAEDPVDSERLTEVAAVLVEFTLKLEPWAVTYWKDIAPDAKNQVYQTLNKDLPRFVSGDGQLTREAIARSAYRLRSLISLLMKGVTEAGRQFARDHLARFSVEEISRAAGPGTLMTSKDVLCWKQYVRQMEGVDAVAIEKRLKSLIARDVDAALSQVIR